MSQIFPEPCGSYNINVQVKLDSSNYAAKSEVKAAAGTDKTSDVKKLDLDKLQTVPNDLIKFSNVVVYNVVKKPIYDKFDLKHEEKSHIQKSHIQTHL